MMRVWGRVGGGVNGVGGTWTLVQTAPNGDNSLVYLTALCQTLKLSTGEDPFNAQAGIDGPQSVMTQIAPDLAATGVQTLYAPFFASLIINRVLGVNPPTYTVMAVTKAGAQLGPIPVIAT
jgi:hypothetical protein